MESKVIDIIKRAEGIYSYRFKGSMTYEAGQFFFVTIEGNKKKHFSFTSSPTDDYVEFTKKLTDSEYSQALRRLKTGDSVGLENPKGEFVMGDSKKLAFVTGGIGLTPFISMLRYVDAKDLDKDIVMLYSNKTRDLPFKKELDEFSKKENIKVEYTVTQDESWEGRTERIDEEMIKEVIPDWKEREFFVSGPPKMVETLEKIIKNMGIEKIKTENFPGY
jgi:ferredoxin-NADP reductase